jgi:protein-L-isoaspartate(D-aspartate) O-methyltransferase
MDLTSTLDAQSFAAERRHMVESQLRSRGIHDARVLDAMLRVPRHSFVAEPSRQQAYADHPLPIGEEQTISQPFINAISLQALSLTGREKVLEIGTGSGYQTALLALLAESVYSIERHSALARSAEAVLAQLGLSNVSIAVADGSRGWREHAPFHAILVSAAAPQVPESLLEQLADGGRMVIPVGSQNTQELQLVTKAEGSAHVEIIEGCRFVPLIGAEGFNPALG